MWKLRPLNQVRVDLPLIVEIDGKPLDLESKEAELLLPKVEDYSLDVLLASNVPLQQIQTHVVTLEDSVQAENYLDKNFDNLIKENHDEN